jgi:hypothetical protein
VIIAKKIALTRRLNRPITNDSSADSASAPARPIATCRPARAEPRARDRDAVGADAEEHRVREADDAGVAEQQVEARDQHDEDDDLRRRR